MRRLINWIAGLLAGIAAYRLFKRWQSPTPAPAPPAKEPDGRAEELRTKLAESRAPDEPSRDEPSPVEPSPVEPLPVEPSPVESSPAAPDASPEPLEERRRHVHEHGRAAIDEMRGDSEMQGGDEKP